MKPVSDLNKKPMPAVFLDRDGVILENRAEYIRTWEDVEFLPGALEALRRLSAEPYRLFIVTNQAVIGHGIISLEQAKAINDRVVTAVGDHGGRIDAVFMCPHTPSDKCDCRKPRPGLLLQAVSAFETDLGSSILIGDTFNDLLAGQSAGISRLGLVRTGLGNRQEQSGVPGALESQFDVFDDLSAAVFHYL